MSTPITEQLRDFHITGSGLEDLTADLTARAVKSGELPSQDEYYPVRIAEDYSAHPGGKGKGWLVGFEAGAAATLAAAALLEARLEARAAHERELRKTAGRLRDLLTLDESHGEEEESADRLETALGGWAGGRLNIAALAGAIRGRTKPVHRMEAARKERCRRALGELREAAEALAALPRFFVFHGEGEFANPLGGEARAAADPCAAALEHCRGMLRAAEAGWRALRVGRLELDTAFESAIHEPILERFRWEAADETEIAAMPPVLVVVTAAEAAQCRVGSISQLLSSGCPIHMVITQPVLTEEHVRDGAPEFAAMAVAQRDAFVLQGSLARVDHLLAGLSEMARCLRPGLAVVATPGAGGWAESSIAVLSRAWPLYRFDPGRGESMRDAMRLETVAADGWTPAHAVAANPELQHHFRLLPDEEGLEDPVELGAYLELFRKRAPLAIPFLRLARDGGEMRIALSRDLAEYCHDRQRCWKIVEEWANGPAAVAAPEPAPRESNEEAMRRGAELAVSRVVALLTGGAQ